MAAGIVALAPGTDTGGSIRCPASVCGIVGLKPTFGRVSLAGIHPLCPSLDHCGPMARSVRDAALALEVLAGPRRAIRARRRSRCPATATRSEAGVAGRTIGIAERFFFEHTDPELAAIVRSSVDILERAGARLVEIDLEWPVDGLGQARFYLADIGAALVGHWPQDRDRIGPDVRADMERLDRITGHDAGLIQGLRLAYQGRMLEKMHDQGIDMIVSPTEPCTPPTIGTLTLPFAGDLEADVTHAMCGLTSVYDALGWPAISVPCGTDALGMPVGLQIAARPWAEADCLAAAAVVERELV